MKHTLQLVFLLLLPFYLCQCKSDSTLASYTERKILVRGNTSEPSTLDPQVATGITESNILRALFEGLCVEDPKDPSIHRPGAAATWSSNAESTEWVFHLQPEGKWSDGKPITAHDFIFAYHRILHPSFGAKYASMLYYIKGAEDYNKDHKEVFLIQQRAPFKQHWEELKQINFRGDSSVNLKPMANTDYNDLSDAEKIAYIQGSGLNNLTKDALQEIKSNQAFFAWPASVPKDTRTAILDTYIRYYDQDLWSIANIGIHASDDYTLEIQLRSPVPFLPDLTKHYTWYPVPKHVILKHGELAERRTKWTEPENLVSNGPFRMKTWKFNYKIELERNPYYWDSSTVDLNGVLFLPITNKYTEARMFYNDQLHITDSLAPELIQYSAQKHPDSTRQETYLGTNFLRFNNKHEGLSDINLRKAFAYATDSKSLIDYVLKGGQQVATGIVPPMGNYEAAKDLSFDPEKAKAFFAKTKYAQSPESLNVVLLTTDRELSKNLAEALQAMWLKHLGVDVKIEQREWTSYLDRMSKLDYGIVTGGWIGDYPDPTTFLDMWKSGDGNNRTGWSSEAYEAKLSKASITSDPAKRIAILQEAEAIFMNDMPLIPVYWYTKNYLIHPSVKNWHPMIMFNQPYKFITLEN